LVDDGVGIGGGWRGGGEMSRLIDDSESEEDEDETEE
jgi:hypothetical protein